MARVAEIDLAHAVGIRVDDEEARAVRGDGDRTRVRLVVGRRARCVARAGAQHGEQQEEAAADHWTE